MQTTQIPYNAINRLLDLIALCDSSITRYRNMGEKEDGLPIRQEKFIKNRHLQELNQILQESNLYVEIMTKENLAV